MDHSNQTSNFKLQISNKSQISNFNYVWCLVFGVSLVFGFWCLNFASKGGKG